MELVEKIVTNPVTLGATAVAIGTAADAVAQSSTAPEDRKTCVRRLAAWSDKLKREHKHLHTAMLTVHSLVSGACSCGVALAPRSRPRGHRHRDQGCCCRW